MMRRARQIVVGNRVAMYDLEMTVEAVHAFDRMDLGRGCFTPACVLIIFSDGRSVSLEPNDKVRLISAIPRKLTKGFVNPDDVEEL